MAVAIRKNKPIKQSAEERRNAEHHAAYASGVRDGKKLALDVLKELLGITDLEIDVARHDRHLDDL